MPNEAISVLLIVLEKGCTSYLLSCRSIINELFKVEKESHVAKLIKDVLDKNGASEANKNLFRQLGGCISLEVIKKPGCMGIIICVTVRSHNKFITHLIQTPYKVTSYSPLKIPWCILIFV